jgi:hypothetical protein
MFLNSLGLKVKMMMKEKQPPHSYINSKKAMEHSAGKMLMILKLRPLKP